MRVVQLEDVRKDLLSYDAEYYKGNNDGDYTTHLNNHVEDEYETEEITNKPDELSETINILHHKHNQDIFLFDEI